MSVTGQEDQFPSPCLSGRRRLGEATFTGIGGKEEDAPTTAIRETAIELVKSTLSGHQYAVRQTYKSALLS